IALRSGADGNALSVRQRQRRRDASHPRRLHNPLRPCQPRRHGPRRRLVHAPRSEEHTSELQSQSNLVCRLLLEKKKPNNRPSSTHIKSGRPPSLNLKNLLTFSSAISPATLYKN